MARRGKSEGWQQQLQQNCNNNTDSGNSNSSTYQPLLHADPLLSTPHVLTHFFFKAALCRRHFFFTDEETKAQRVQRTFLSFIVGSLSEPWSLGVPSSSSDPSPESLGNLRARPREEMGHIQLAVL